MQCAPEDGNVVITSTLKLKVNMSIQDKAETGRSYPMYNSSHRCFGGHDEHGDGYNNVDTVTEYRLRITINGNTWDDSYKYESFKTIEDARSWAKYRIEDMLVTCHGEDGQPITLKDIKILVVRQEVTATITGVCDMLGYETYYKYFDTNHKRI